MSQPVFVLENPVQNYAWGSRTAIADLLGRPAPSALPEAELWIGAHPKAPSRVVAPPGLGTLDRVIQDDPVGHPRPRGLRPFRQRAALPPQGAGRRRAALDPGPPEPRAGPPRLGPGERRGRARGRPPPELPRPEPQARAGQRAHRLHGPQGLPAPGRRRPQPRARRPARDRPRAGTARARAEPRSPCAPSSRAS